MQTGFAGTVFIIYPGARLNGYDKKYCLKKDSSTADSFCGMIAKI